jgi:hypothetical protein
MTLEIVLLAAAIALLAYVLVGYGVVGAAHMNDPRLRKAPQVTQFLGLALWGPIAIHHRLAAWRKRRNRPRLPR